MKTMPADAGSAARVLPLIDLTSLGDDDTAAKVERLCADAVTELGPVAAVCVWPRFVTTAAALLQGTAVGIAAVANFPDGSTDVSRAVADGAAIVAAGGTEVDVVYPWRALASGDQTSGPAVVSAVRTAVGSDVTLKVILETGELADEQLIRRAAADAMAAGADFLKTSTGKTEHSVTPETAQVLLDVIKNSDRPVGLKISGGVRTVVQATVYLDLVDAVMGPDWASQATFRFGASGLLTDVLGMAGTSSQSMGEDTY